jgi:protein-tyrosine phosphatase
VGCRPYIKDAQRILSEAHETRNPRITQQKIDFLHLPIIDGSVTTDTAMHRLAEDCCARVLKGEKLYVHCWGGHGRTGTLIAVMLGRLYGMPQTESLRYCQIFHDSRTYPQGVRSPQTPVQRAQVRT